MQIDLLIDRRDHVINLCEIKFSLDVFAIEKNYAEALRHKIVHFTAESKTKKALALTFISTYGLARNQYAGLAQKELTMDALFGR